MDERAVTLMIRYKRNGKWHRSTAARSANGRVKPGYALIEQVIDGHKRPMRVPVEDWTYDLRHTVDRKSVYTPAGKDPTAANRKLIQLASTKELLAKAERNPEVQIVEKPSRPNLRQSADAYINMAIRKNAMEAADKSRLVTADFIQLARRRKKEFVDQIGADDIADYDASLTKRGLSRRTISNNHKRLASWLRFAGHDPKSIPPAPKYVEQLPTIYTSDDLREMLDGSAGTMRVRILLALKCGLRDQELMHLEFSDINWGDRTLRVREKPQWQFFPKTWEQRDIPVPSDLLEELSRWQETRADRTLILGTRSDSPDTHQLRTFKRFIRKIDLNCGKCAGCRNRRVQECAEFTLHKFRRTYLTTLLRNGFDLRTVQEYAGHKKIESTMRYLRPQAATESQTKLNAVVW